MGNAKPFRGWRQGRNLIVNLIGWACDLMRTKKSWTSDRPESPGQYWVRTVASEGVPIASRILWHDGRLVVFLNEPGQPSRWVPLDDAYPDETRAEFLGPVSP